MDFIIPEDVRREKASGMVGKYGIGLYNKRKEKL